MEEIPERVPDDGRFDRGGRQLVEEGLERVVVVLVDEHEPLVQVAGLSALRHTSLASVRDGSERFIPRSSAHPGELERKIKRSLKR